MHKRPSPLGIVVVGRNEARRLTLCLRSVVVLEPRVVYVDSGSTDRSVAIAREAGVVVIELDQRTPMNASRARAEGARFLLDACPGLELLQFLDGDCELSPGWLETARAFLATHLEVAVVAGRRREALPNASLYNALCDDEWDTPVGEARSIGGDSLMRAGDYVAAGGFDPTVSAGEEPEFCGRVRRLGRQVWRLDAEMSVHDADIHSFAAWWRRQVRTGYGGFDVERRFRLGEFSRLLRSALFWGGVFPLAAVSGVAAALVLGGPLYAGAAAIAAALVWTAQGLKIACSGRRRGMPWKKGLVYGALTMIAKFPIVWGASRAAWRAMRRRHAETIEYKRRPSLGGRRLVNDPAP